MHKPQHLLPYGILVLFLFAEAAFCTKPSPCHNPASPCVLYNNCVSALGHLCVWAHLCFHVSVSESLWFSLCQYSSFCSSVWPAPCPITESCSGLSSLSSVFSSPRCDIYFCPRSTFVVSFSLIVTRSHLLFFFFCFHSPSPLSQVLF